MTEPERRALRLAISEARRARLPAEPERCPETERALSYAYRYLGCRCAACCEHQNAERARRKRGELRGEAPVRQEHGASAYKRRRCSCAVCKEAAAKSKREQRLRAKERAMVAA